MAQFLTLLTGSFFLLAILYDLQFPSDDGSCEVHGTETEYLQRRSMLDPRLSYFQWVSLPSQPSAGVLVEIHRRSGIIVQTYDIAEIENVNGGGGDDDGGGGPRKNHECRFNGSADSFVAYFVPIVITTMISIPMTLVLDALFRLMAHRSTAATTETIHRPSCWSVAPHRPCHPSADEKWVGDNVTHVRPVELLPSPSPSPSPLPPLTRPMDHPLRDNEPSLDEIYHRRLPLETTRSRRRFLRLFREWKGVKSTATAAAAVVAAVEEGTHGQRSSSLLNDDVGVGPDADAGDDELGVYAVQSLMSLLLLELFTAGGGDGGDGREAGGHPERPWPSVRADGVQPSHGASAMWEWIVR